MTRSGQIFPEPKLSVRSKDPKGKSKADVGEGNKTGLTPNDELPAGKFSEEGYSFRKKGLLSKEATEFLRIIQ